MNVKLLIDNIAILDSHCKDLLASNNPVLHNINKIQSLLADHYSEAKEKFINHTFESINQQIDYFKLYHPKMISLCLHYRAIRTIENRLLSLSPKKQLKILHEEKENLDNISRDNPEFIIYITEHASHFDADYFTFEGKNKSINSFSYLDRDPSFSTHHSFLFGKILGTYRTLQYIVRKLNSLKNQSNQNTTQLQTLKWNRKKVDYIETIRALHAEGAFTGDITHIFNALSQVIVIGQLDHFSQYNDIKNRSNSKTKYLNKAAQALSDKIAEDYE